MIPRPPAFDRIGAVLRRVRRRLRARIALGAAGWLLAVTGGVLLLALLVLGLGLDGAAAPIAVAIVLAAAALATLVAAAGRPLRATGRDEAVAAHLEAGLGGLDDAVFACVQYAREWPRPGRGDPLLAAALAERVAGRLDAADLRAVTPMRPARPGWLAAAGVAAAWGLVGLTAGDLLARGAAALFPAGLSGDAREVGPLVGDLDLTLHYPPHTGRAPRLIPNSTGDIDAPKGTRVELRATTLEPAREAALRFGDAVLPLALRDGRELTGGFVVDGPIGWRFQMQDARGATLVEQGERKIRVEPDQPPTVTLKLPAEDLELDDLRAVPVVYEARDDFGLSRAAIVVALAADADHPEAIDQPGVTGLRIDGEDEVDLSVIQAQAGDRLMLYVEAYDNNGVDGPQRGVSATRFITVNSPQAAHFELTERLRQTIEVLLDALADRLEIDWKATETPLARQLGDVMLGSREAATALAGVVEAMTEDPLTPDEVRLALSGRLGSLEEALADEKQAVDPRVAEIERGEDAAVRAASRANEAVVEQLEQAIVLVEAMVARLALEDMAALAEELKTAQARLRELVEQYRQNPNDEALKARIMRDIRRLRDRMAEMRARMAQLRQKLPEEFLNLDGLEKDDVAKGLDETRNQLGELQKMLEEGKIDEALAALDEMDKALDELSASLDQDMQDLHEETNPAMQRAISELMDQTRDLMKRQQEVGEKTEALARAEEEARRKAIEEAFAEKLAGIKQDAEGLRRTVDELAREELSVMAEEDLEHLRQRADEINRALDQKQLMEALEMAERAMDHLDGLDRFNRFEPEDRKVGALIERGRQQDGRVMRELAELIDEARRRAERAVPPEQAEQLRQDQQGLSEAAERLRQRIGERGQEVPGLADQPMERARQAGQSMREAAEQLRQGRPGQARPGQQQAESQLQSLMEGLRQAAQPQRAERGQEQRGRQRQERVRIPGAEEYEAPAEFREELLDAMKQKPPEEYREQVKRYYESLIR
ncbi:MAG: DUF4175 family protein [Myxococcales bacterium]|nr:DUF4175 family protein [Myxococcales bacterium]